jgi:hypothetical protein
MRFSVSCLAFRGFGRRVGPKIDRLFVPWSGCRLRQFFLGEVILGRFGAGRGFMLIEVTAPRE